MQFLSHYTRRAGLEGIARSKSLRATRFSELNDKREMEYGFTELTLRAMRAAYREAEKLLKPTDQRRQLDYHQAAKEIAGRFKKSFEGDAGSEPLYIVSFAEARTEDHQRRGILTLWDRYTRLEGYCLQFDANEIQALLKLESTRRNYALLETLAVRYGIVARDLQDTAVEIDIGHA
jgi:hypothetical protein